MKGGHCGSRASDKPRRCIALPWHIIISDLDPALCLGLWLNLPSPQLFLSITPPVTPLSIPIPSPLLLPRPLMRDSEQIKSIDCHFVNLKHFSSLLSPFLDAGTQGSLIFPLWNDSLAELRIHQPPPLSLCQVSSLSPSITLPLTLSLSFLHSHNTKTTSWLDPRLAKKAKPPEECKEDGEYSSSIVYSFFLFYAFLPLTFTDANYTLECKLLTALISRD